MNVDEAIKVLQEIQKQGYGQNEIEIASYAGQEEQPSEIDEIELTKSKKV
ncbi:MAG: hypothetical protein GY797_23135, partial [Deltaproteobacteria bacterium]|nr:hypothetical protein [Deltaproteobacteria bacterium]